MPGPCNAKKRKKVQAKKDKRAQAKQVQLQPLDSTPCSGSHSPSPERPVQTLQYSSQVDTQRPILLPEVVCATTEDTYQSIHGVSSLDDNYAESLQRMRQYLAPMEPDDVPETLRNPCVEDHGDGPRVRDVRAFLNSSVAAPVSLDDPLCAEFAQTEVLEMLMCVLPEETAMIAWYNLSRMKSRVCPACKRLYHLGETFPEPFVDKDGDASVRAHDIKDTVRTGKQEDSRKLHNEQIISGICSALCYFLVAHNYPGAIRATFGRRAEDISDDVWDELNGPGAGAEDKMSFGMLLKMTRCHDMGLEQLILPRVMELRTAEDDISDESDYDYEEEEEDPEHVRPTVLIEHSPP